MATTIVIKGRLFVECDECDGTGLVEIDSFRKATCKPCKGEGWVPLRCTFCQEQADVIDGGIPKCREAYEEDHPDRRLPRVA